MNAVADTPVAPVQKSNAWKWVVGVVVLGVFAFLMLGRSLTNDYEAAVTRQIGAPAGTVAFVDVKRYKSGVVCGTANPSAGALQRFIVGVQGDILLDDGTPAGTLVFNMTSTKICRD